MPEVSRCFSLKQVRQHHYKGYRGRERCKALHLVCVPDRMSCLGVSYELRDCVHLSLACTLPRAQMGQQSAHLRLLVWPRDEEQQDAGVVDMASRSRVEHGEVDRASMGWKNV